MLHGCFNDTEEFMHGKKIILLILSGLLVLSGCSRANTLTETTTAPADSAQTVKISSSGAASSEAPAFHTLFRAATEGGTLLRRYEKI